jgi:hypothetical protein
LSLVLVYPFWWLPSDIKRIVFLGAQWTAPSETWLFQDKSAP